jgi:hypothetical protein
MLKGLAEVREIACMFKYFRTGPAESDAARRGDFARFYCPDSALTAGVTPLQRRGERLKLAAASDLPKFLAR